MILYLRNVSGYHKIIYTLLLIPTLLKYRWSQQQQVSLPPLLARILFGSIAIRYQINCTMQFWTGSSAAVLLAAEPTSHPKCLMALPSSARIANPANSPTQLCVSQPGNSHIYCCTHRAEWGETEGTCFQGRAVMNSCKDKYFHPAQTCTLTPVLV